MLRASLLGCVLVAASFPSVRAEDDPLKEFAERYAIQQMRVDEARTNAKTDQERKEAFEKLDPRNVFMDDLLAIEKSHRGQPAAISALYRLMYHAGKVGNPDLPAAQGRVKAIQVLCDHYLEHPDLNLLLGNFNSGTFVAEAETLLQQATKSPHPHVRASARYHLARFLVHKALLEELFGASSPPPDPTIEMTPQMAEVRLRVREQLSNLAVDPAAERKKALRVIAQIIAEDSEVVGSFVKREGPGNLSVRRASAEEFKTTPTTFAKLSEALRFELQHLQPGQVAPEIVAKDADGLEFKLSDYRGRVVLLMFSANWCGPCKGMYPDLRKLQAELGDGPFTTLGVMADERIESVIQDTQRGDIRWRTWFDGNQGPIATTWNIQGRPTVFLIDHNGAIVSRDPGRSYETLKKAIDKLLVARQADPKAEAEVKAHPLPELPILKQTK